MLTVDLASKLVPGLLVAIVVLGFPYHLPFPEPQVSVPCFPASNSDMHQFSVIFNSDTISNNLVCPYYLKIYGWIFLPTIVRIAS